VLQRNGVIVDELLDIVRWDKPVDNPLRPSADAE
jgi:hypothetical protein